MVVGYIVYSEDKNISHEKLNALFRKAAWPIRNNWQELLAVSSFVVTASVAGELVGVGRLFEEKNGCCLYDLVVHPDFRRRGVGTTIVGKIEQEAQARGYPAISADSASKEAQQLFKKLGYLEIRRELHGDRDKIFYVKDLTT